MSRSQLKLAAALTALVVLVVLVSGALAERGLRAGELERLEASLLERAGLVRELCAGTPITTDSIPQLDAIADRAAGAAGARVTLIARDGTVVGDSDVPAAKIREVANHARRPEVQAALRGAPGHATRRSATVGRDLFYLAVPAEDGAGGVVRVADELSELESAVSLLRTELMAAGAIGVLAAIALSFLLARLILRPLEELRQAAASIAGGDLERRMPVRASDELGDISSAIDQMAEQLRLRLEEVTNEKEQLQAVLNAMVEGVLVVDSGGKIMLANQQVRGFFGLRGEVESRRVIEVIRSVELDELLADAERSSDPVSAQLVIPGPIQRTLHAQAAPFPARAGQRIGTVAVFHDVTELVRSDQVRRDFVANASHELRTPLTAIRGFAETLLSGGASGDEQRSYIEIIDRHARRLGSLVADLLELSKIEGREIDLRPEVLDVTQIAEALVRDLRPRFDEKQLDVGVETEGDATAWGDVQAVEQILSNLLDNAIKYTEQAGQIRVRIQEQPESLAVSVSDTGIGIPESERERVFERFYRVDKARSRALGGTGLGLSIVKHLVQRQGGVITVESQLGRGSTFRFTLPRERASSTT